MNSNITLNRITKVNSNITLNNIKNFTLQQVFDFVATHLIKQGCRAMGTFGKVDWDGTTVANTGCAYRGDNGTKCAVGVLIPDCDYKIEMEGKGFYALASNYYLDMLEDKGLERMNSLLVTLQGVHDSADRYHYSNDTNVEFSYHDHIVKGLATVARHYNLNTHVLN